MTDFGSKVEISFEISGQSQQFSSDKIPVGSLLYFSYEFRLHALSIYFEDGQNKLKEIYQFPFLTDK